MHYPAMIITKSRVLCLSGFGNIMTGDDAVNARTEDRARTAVIGYSI
jgi:hypothetical protein